MVIWPITLAEQSKAWTVFARSNAGIVGLNPTLGMDVCIYSVFVLLCVQVEALRRTDPSSKESYRLCKKDYETEEQARAQQRADEWMNGQVNMTVPSVGCDFSLQSLRLNPGW
jgi:hypothetical protein